MFSWLSRSRFILFTLILAFSVSGTLSAAEKNPLSLLFLGDNGHHQPRQRFEQLSPVMRTRGIDLTYTDDMREINEESLSNYDGLVIYANTTEISPEQEAALLDFVASGKGFIPLHCASYCFLNSEKYIALVGAQFLKHETGIFRTNIVSPDHPVMKGYHGFRSWDETYVHHKHNSKNRTVLETRTQGESEEPWTWVRTHGKGRVFYTAWGHDDRTWSHPGFQNLIERGIRWACGSDPAVAGPYADRLPMTELPPDMKPFDYVDVGPKIPNYTPSEKWGTQGKPLTLMQKPLSPEESLKHYVTPEDFELQLFVSEPDLKGKPIAMNWDARGRLWVCETVDYPNELRPPGEGRDRIRICEDTDHDGRADKFTVFAEQLSIPTAIEFWRGGAIVQNGTETLYLKDTDGDDVADTRKVLFGGWELGDTHGGVSNFRYGLNNWIYAMQGYNNSAPTINGEEQQRFRMGFFRFKPDGSEIEFLRSTNNNTWGLGITEEGLIFGSTANHNPSDFMPIPNRYYERVKGWAPQRLEGIADTYKFDPITDKIRQVDQFGGYTAGAGHAVYTARTYPEYFWNRTAFVCGPTGHLVGTFLLNPDGAGFHSTSPMNLIASDDEWSAPIMAEVGPDGHVWVIDWYNYIVQHNPTPQGFETGQGNAYMSDLRDKKHGRIYRVVYKKADQYEPVDLVNASPQELVALLKHDNMFWRLRAQRLLVERGKNDVMQALVQLLMDHSVDELGLNVGAIHALWTLDGLGLVHSENPIVYEAVVRSLLHPSTAVRKAAIQTLPYHEQNQNIGHVIVSQPFSQTDAQLQLAAILAVSDTPQTDEYGSAGDLVARISCQDEFLSDRWLKDALTSAAAMHDLHYLTTFSQPGVAPHAQTHEIISIVSEHLARSEPDSKKMNQLLVGLKGSDSGLLLTVLSGLSEGWPKDYEIQINDQAQDALLGWIEKLPPGAKGQLIALAPKWGTDRLEKYAIEIVDDLMQQVENEERSAEDRVESARSLVTFRSTDLKVAESILDLIGAQTEPVLADGLLNALRQSQADGVGEAIVDKLPEMTPSVKATAFRVLLSNPKTTTALLSAAAEGEVSLSELSLDQKQALANHPNAQIREMAKPLLAMGGGLPNPDRQKVFDALVSVTERTGNPEQGRELFKKHCAKCHKHGDMGETIGPNLTGMAVHPKKELLGHIIDPSKDVEGNYRIYTIVTDEGRVFNGLLASESKTTLELIDTEAKKHTILREEIEELIASRKSLMPEGFEKQMTETELADLLEFLTQKGKYVPLPLAKAATIVSTQGMFFDKAGQAERMIFSDWSPKTFNEVPFQLVDPQGTKVRNVILLHGPYGNFAPTMPKSVTLPCNAPAKAIHFLSGVSGWGFPATPKGSVSMIVRLHYADGSHEDHELINGVHFSDYIRRIDVPGSEFAFQLRNQQLRYFAVTPKTQKVIEKVELLSGGDPSAPIVMAVTVETP
ncbi:MAG: ThuA domain-containing protein [Planctomycetaceae bacterium]|nr:ThuA domain-containing protein [Planctomycetaceae bacterium]